MPFTNENLKVLFTVVGLGVIGFLLPSFENKIMAIAFKSTFLSLSYFYIIYRFKIAIELQEMVFGFFKKKEL
jgi:hypothetical protein